MSDYWLLLLAIATMLVGLFLGSSIELNKCVTHKPITVDDKVYLCVEQKLEGK